MLNFFIFQYFSISYDLYSHFILSTHKFFYSLSVTSSSLYSSSRNTSMGAKMIAVKFVISFFPIQFQLVIPVCDDWGGEVPPLALLCGVSQGLVFSPFLILTSIWGRWVSRETQLLCQALQLHNSLPVPCFHYTTAEKNKSIQLSNLVDIVISQRSGIFIGMSFQADQLD